MKSTSSTSLRFALLTALTASVISLYGISPLLAIDGNGRHTARESESGGGGSGGGHGGGGNDDGGGHDAGDDDGADDHGKNEFLGTIKALPATAGFVGTWTVDDKLVLVSTDTQIRSEHGLPTVGGKVEVEGILLADGSVDASRIKTEDKRTVREDNVYFGKIEALPAAGVVGTWQVSGLTMLVTSTTRVETEKSAAAIGLTVRIEGTQQADASIIATEIEIQDSATLPVTTAASVKGAIQKLPATAGNKGNWLVNNVLVTVTGSSKTVSGIAKALVGKKVTIAGLTQINGTVLARTISVSKLYAAARPSLAVEAVPPASPAWFSPGR